MSKIVFFFFWDIIHILWKSQIEFSKMYFFFTNSILLIFSNNLFILVLGNTFCIQKLISSEILSRWKSFVSLKMLRQIRDFERFVGVYKFK